MTDFITGRACTDVTGALYSKVIETVTNGDNAVVIVPDQFVFETEKTLFRKCAKAGRTELFQKIRVRTIAKLSDDIIKAYMVDKPPADDITKTVIMYNAVNNSKRGADLTSLGRIARKPGFAAKMVKTVSLFKTAGIDAGKLGSSLDDESFPLDNKALLGKLKDIYSLYLEYDQMLSQNFTDKLDVTMRAADLAMRRDYFAGYNVFVDGFNTFSGSQLMLLKAAAEKARHCLFAFVCDKDDERDIFRPLLADIDALSCGSGIPAPDAANSRGMAPGIQRASELVFGNTPDPDADMSSVRIISADDIYSEMDFIAAEIKRLTTEEGFRYNEIAVLCSSPNEYRSPAESAFSKYGIPLFCDIPDVILNTPLTNLVLSLLKALDEPSAENLLSYVRNSFLRVKKTSPDSAENGGSSDESTENAGREKVKFRPLTYADIDCFDGYIYHWQIKGELLEKPFATEGMSRRETSQAVLAEKVRKLAVEPLLALRRVIAGTPKDKCTGAWLSRQVCGYLFSEAGIASAMYRADDSSKALWEILVKIFEAINSGIGDVPMTVREYYSLFRDICAETTLAMPPKFADSVIIGDTGRTRADNIRAVFIAGANYGLFPDETKSLGLFSDYEAELLNDSGLKLSLKQAEIYNTSRYQAYRALSLATDKLYLTVPMLNTACTKLTPSEVVADLLALFPQIKTENACDPEQFDDKFYCRSQNALRARYASLFGTTDADRRSTLRLALEKSDDGEYAQKLDRLVTERPRMYRHRITARTSKELFRDARISATKLEKLNLCRFEYFCKYGLNIRERSRLNNANSSAGSAVHYVLENVMSEYCTKMDALFELDRKALNDLSVRYLMKYAEENFGGAEYRSRAFSYMFSGLSLACTDMLVLIQNEFRSRSYRPVLFELKLESNKSVALPQADPAKNSTVPEPVGLKSISVEPLKIKISNELTVAITGTVDRVDMFHKGGADYFRVVDYKTGDHSFDMSNALSGVNTQMLIYLIALNDSNDKLTPGGVSYSPAGTTDADKADTPLLTRLAKDHIPSTMIVSDASTKAEIEQFASRFTEAMIASVRSRPSMVKALTPNVLNSPTTAQFDTLRKMVIDQTTDVVSKLFSGRVEAVPVIYSEGSVKNKKSCRFCRYKAVCGNADKHGIIVDESLAARTLYKPKTDGSDGDGNKTGSSADAADKKDWQEGGYINGYRDKMDRRPGKCDKPHS